MPRASANEDGEFDLSESINMDLRSIENLVDEKIVNSYKGYRLSLFELKKYYELLNKTNSINDDNICNEIIKMSIITIVKCFNKSEQRNQLDRKIFKGLNNYYYNHLERIRNRYIAHDSSDYSNCEVYLGG